MAEDPRYLEMLAALGALPASMEPIRRLLHGVWPAVVLTLPSVAAGQVLAIMYDGENLQASIQGRAALRNTVVGLGRLARVARALAHEPLPGLVRVVVLAPEGGVSMQVAR